MPVYTFGFFAFCLIGPVSCALSVFLAQTTFEVNRCTLEPDDRPADCPRRCADEAPTHVERA